MSNKLKKYLLPLLLAAMPTAYFKEGEGKGATEKISLSISLQRKNANLSCYRKDRSAPPPAGGNALALEGRPPLSPEDRDVPGVKDDS